MRSSFLVPLAFGLLLLGCDRLASGDGGANLTGCRDRRTAVTANEVLPLGFPPAGGSWGEPPIMPR